jgi:hypothetical protein
MESGDSMDANRPKPNAGRLTLASFFGTFQLTHSQAQAVAELQGFLDDPRARCFVLRGYAGTGKTFLIGGLVRYLEARRHHTVMMAPTGRAAYVLRDRHRVAAGTIHRTIYSMEKLREHRETEDGGDITYKFYFETKNNDCEHDTVFIVDEASMISDVRSDAEFLRFGSGRLLHDLLEFINFDANDFTKKLILVGDGAQLPPVHMNTSPALDRNYLASHWRLASSESELVDVVRQLESSLVLRNATAMREMLQADRFPSFDFKSDQSTVVEVDPAEFVRRFAETYDRSALQTRSIIVAFTNADVATYNTAVRQFLLPGKSGITKGDRIIVVRNNYKHERPLLNGQMGLVVEAGEEVESRAVPVNVGVGEDGKRINETVVLRFRQVTLKFEGDDHEEYELHCKIIEDCLENRGAELPSTYSKALWVDFRRRNPHLRPDDAVFANALKADPYFTAVQLRFGYAVTCHKAQGGEWDAVFIDFAGMNKLGRSELRWSYTALTRASRAVVATNALHHSLLTPRRPVGGLTPLPSTPASVESVTDKLAPAPTVAPLSQMFDGAGTPFQRGLLNEVQSRLPSGWRIGAIKHVQFQECYTLEKAAYVATARLYFNSSNRVSSVQLVPGARSDLDEELHAALRSITGITIVLGGEPEGAIEPSHVPFVEELRRKGAGAGLSAVRFESKTRYHLVGVFRDGDIEGSFDYYIDKVGRLSREPSPHAGVSSKLVGKVLGLR